jgi:hypothetical protein
MGHKESPVPKATKRRTLSARGGVVEQTRRQAAKHGNK